MEFRNDVNAAVASLEELEELLSVSWGPDGSSVLIEEASGLLSMTRRGWPVVQAAYSERPVKNVFTKIMLEKIKTIHNEIGDGVKTFVFITSAFMKNLNPLQSKSSTKHIHWELKTLLHSLSEICITPASLVLDIKYCINATSALFHTSCSQSVSTALQKAFYEWLNFYMCSFNSEHPHSNNISCLKYLLINFSVLCSKNYSGSRSVSDSCVLPGFLVSRPVLNMDKSKEEQVKIIVYIPDDAVDNIDLETEINCLIMEHMISDDKLLRIMLVTTAVLPDLVLFTLRKKGIIVLHGVPHIDAEYISSFVLNSINYPLITVKSYLIGSQEYTCLKLPHTWQLLIHAPTNSLLREFTTICKNALKLLLIVEKSQIYGLVKAGGMFEKGFSFSLTEKILQTKDLLFPICSRSELLLWHKERRIMKEKFRLISKREITNDENTTDKLTNSKEREQKRQNISNHCSEILDDNQDYEPQKLLNVIFNKMQISNSFDLKLPPTLQKVDPTILEAFAKSMLIVCNLLNCETFSDEVYEPISFKICLLQHVLAAVIGLCKCDMSSNGIFPIVHPGRNLCDAKLPDM